MNYDRIRNVNLLKGHLDGHLGSEKPTNSKYGILDFEEQFNPELNSRLVDLITQNIELLWRQKWIVIYVDQKIRLVIFKGKKTRFAFYSHKYHHFVST